MLQPRLPRLPVVLLSFDKIRQKANIRNYELARHSCTLGWDERLSHLLLPAKSVRTQQPGVRRWDEPSVLQPESSVVTLIALSGGAARCSQPLICCHTLRVGLVCHVVVLQLRLPRLPVDLSSFNKVRQKANIRNHELAKHSCALGWDECLSHLSLGCIGEPSPSNVACVTSWITHGPTVEVISISA